MSEALFGVLAYVGLGLLFVLLAKTPNAPMDHLGWFATVKTWIRCVMLWLPIMVVMVVIATLRLRKDRV